jgi:hypothetical protein
MVTATTPGTRVEYVVDGDDTIVGLGTGWERFPPNAYLGTTLWDVIHGHDVVAVWRLLLQRIRTTRLPLSFLYRCDEPELERTYLMALEPLGSAVIFRSTLVDARARGRVSLLDPAVPNAGEPLIACSWCGRVRLEEWVEPGVAVTDLGLLRGAVSRPPLTYGICELCDEEMRELSRPGRH